MKDKERDDEQNEYVEPPHAHEATAANVDDTEDPGWPWSFILLVVAGAIYLVFRFADLVINLLR